MRVSGGERKKITEQGALSIKAPRERKKSRVSQEKGFSDGPKTKNGHVPEKTLNLPCQPLKESMEGGTPISKTSRYKNLGGREILRSIGGSERKPM